MISDRLLAGFIRCSLTPRWRVPRAQMGTDEYVPTVDSGNSFLSPCPGGRIVAIAAIIRCGRQFVFADAKLENDEGKLLASTSATFGQKSGIAASS